MTKIRPNNIPAEARWNEKDKEWELGEKNSQGISVGVWKWWREDGTLCCRTEYIDETGKDISFSRFHQDGTFSWKGVIIQGKNHGIHDCQKSDNPTTETVNIQSKQFDPKIYKWRMFFDMGRQTRSGAFFDKDGNEVSTKGIKKPENLPEEATAVTDGTWRLELNSDGVLDKFNGVLCDWDDQGRLYKKSTYSLNPTKIKKIEFLDIQGNVYIENDYVSCKGYILKPQNEFFSNTDLMGFFKGKIEKITYDFSHNDDLNSLVYLRSNVRYFDGSGKQLTSNGEDLVKPTAGAKLILKNTYQGTEMYFYESEFKDLNNKNGLLTIWFENGKKKLEAEFKSNAISRLKTFDLNGLLKTDEIYELNQLAVGNRQMIKSFKLFVGQTSREFLYDKDGYNNIQNIYEDNRLIKTLDNKSIKEGLVTAEFIEAFNERYKDTESFALVEFNGYFGVRSNEVFDNNLQDCFKRSVIAADGAGNELFIILEPGEYFGKIYDNDHETGLYSVEDSECIFDYLYDENDIEEDDIETMDKNELIKLLPFCIDDTIVAENLNELINSVYISSWESYRNETEDLLKIITSAK